MKEASDQSQNRGRTDIRVQRRKDVADITRDVVKGKANLPDMMAGLHRTLSDFNKADHMSRKVLTTVLEANFILAQTVEVLTTDVAALKEQVAVLMRERKTA